jgi:uncharacterized protein (TIGR00725 family)
LENIAKLRIGVYGSWRSEAIPQKAFKWAFLLGKEVALRGHMLITGGSPGVPLETRRGCFSGGGRNLAIIPYSKIPPNISDASFLDIVIPSGMGTLGRMPLLANTVDFAFSIGGGAGTLIEVLSTYLQKKPVIIVDGLQRENDPIIEIMLTRSEEVHINGTKIRIGWFDSKSEEIVSPVYLINYLIKPEQAFDIGLQIYHDSKQKWGREPSEDS